MNKPNINGHRQQIAAQLADLAEFVGQDNFNLRIPDSEARRRYHARMELLGFVLRNIDDTLNDPAAQPREGDVEALLEHYHPREKSCWG